VLGKESKKLLDSCTVSRLFSVCLLGGADVFSIGCIWQDAGTLVWLAKRDTLDFGIDIYVGQ